MVATILISFALLLLWTVFSKKKKPAPQGEQKFDLELADQIGRLRYKLEESAYSGRKMFVDTKDYQNEFQDLIALEVILGDANVDLTHKGKNIPTAKQVMEKLLSEPRPSP
ncbi:TPA: hypothetical protein OXP03_003229 [Acinetobacter baumannii]|nr:hypothetical protein [Acinetobacter baumannii]EKT9383023.1 hypothetical protein [Acinetobacter baumannii]EKU4682326.1 hypothetical protein [Acinetobacter baumannii]EKW0104064.1 hypothetical protein [Acinetobacter baumannii]EKW0686597.1 hypothetical protein [Acinetobacter baumannii]